MASPNSPAEADSQQELDASLNRLAGVASMMTDVNFLICDENGAVLLTTDDVQGAIGRRAAVLATLLAVAEAAVAAVVLYVRTRHLGSALVGQQSH